MWRTPLPLRQTGHRMAHVVSVSLVLQLRKGSHTAWPNYRNSRHLQKSTFYQCHCRVGKPGARFLKNFMMMTQSSQLHHLFVITNYGHKFVIRFFRKSDPRCRVVQCFVKWLHTEVFIFFSLMRPKYYKLEVHLTVASTIILRLDVLSCFLTFFRNKRRDSRFGV